MGCIFFSLIVGICLLDSFFFLLCVCDAAKMRTWTVGGGEFAKKKERMMADVTTDDGGLRRAYTRSVPAVLRPLCLLEKSMRDVQVQWEEIIEGVTVEDVSLSSGRAAMLRVERLASQLKAIKQELMPRLGHFSHQEEDSEQPFLRYCSCAARTTVNEDNSTCDVADGEQTQAVRLAARVWVWCVCVGTIMNDMELLSTSLSFAASTCLLDKFTEEVRLTEGSTFFLGKDEGVAFPLSDGDLLLACQLLYHLFTGDDAAAEIICHRVLSLIDECEERDDGKECKGCILSRLVRIAECVAAEDYGALQLLMKADFFTGVDTSCSLPPLIIFFTQMMLDTVVHRQLVQGCFQNVWRPVINVDRPARDESPSVPLQAMTTSPFASSRLSFTTKRRLMACCTVFRESLPPRVSWPIPEDLMDRCFRMGF
ncbi:dynein heavy chain, putative [Trypanosoma cruzi marinkellei]|uniref:Dynein heavy chain, putative n=1 Tax=Trypanosoma cruzi marinkellei TaxID=85056 RepID=K2N5Q6_TRYCR|nr:dynein heavy chain, putative [Trypanosoma cruzi marinkellei]